jgi:hypothetical protein
MISSGTLTTFSCFPVSAMPSSLLAPMAPARRWRAATVSALLALIPVAPNILLWPLGIGIGFFLIFGFAAWLAVPSRVSNIRAEHIGSATGLMLTLAAIGGFFIPIIFGQLVPHTSYGTGWVFLAVVSVAFALAGLKGGNPVTAGSP